MTCLHACCRETEKKKKKLISAVFSQSFTIKHVYRRHGHETKRIACYRLLHAFFPITLSASNILKSGPNPICAIKTHIYFTCIQVFVCFFHFQEKGSRQ